MQKLTVDLRLRRREDRELHRRVVSQQLHDPSTVDLQATMVGSDARREGVHAGYVTAVNSLMAHAGRMRSISNRLFTESMSQPRLVTQQRRC